MVDNKMLNHNNSPEPSINMVVAHKCSDLDVPSNSQEHVYISSKSQVSINSGFCSNYLCLYTNRKLSSVVDDLQNTILDLLL